MSKKVDAAAIPLVSTKDSTGDQSGLDFGGVDFWTDRPVSELIAEVGSEPVQNPADLELQGISDEAWAGLHEVLGSGR